MHKQAAQLRQARFASRAFEWAFRRRRRNVLAEAIPELFEDPFARLVAHGGRLVKVEHIDARCTGPGFEVDDHWEWG